MITDIATIVLTLKDGTVTSVGSSDGATDADLKAISRIIFNQYQAALAAANNPQVGG